MLLVLVPPIPILVLLLHAPVMELPVFPVRLRLPLVVVDDLAIPVVIVAIVGIVDAHARCAAAAAN